MRWAFQQKLNVSARLFVSAGLDDIIDLEDHLGNLRGEEKLLVLASQRLEYPLLPHVISAHVIAVDAQVRVPLLDLHRPQESQALLLT